MAPTPLALQPWLELLEEKFGSIDNFDGVLTMRYQEAVGLRRLAEMEKQLKPLLVNPSKAIDYLERTADERGFLLSITQKLARRIRELDPVMVPEDPSIAA